jgi:hypothetical protein
VELVAEASPDDVTTLAEMVRFDHKHPEAEVRNFHYGAR